MNKGITLLTLLTVTTVLAFGVLMACDNGHEATETGSRGIGHEQGNEDKQNHDEHSGHGGGHDTASGSYHAQFAWNEPPTAGIETELSVQITDKDGRPVQEFEVNHEKLLHLIIVNRDLSFFNHIHPDYKENGVFTVNTTFPTGGEYQLFADFVPKGAAGTTLSEWVNIEGQEEKTSTIESDTSLIKQVDGKEIELRLSNTLSNEEVVLTYHIQDAKTKQGIDNLEPYLGAVGHVVILSADADQYLHVHPLDEKGTGPTAEFATAFPHSGVYKIWAQFQHRGKVITVPFVVEIQ